MRVIFRLIHPNVQDFCSAVALVYNGRDIPAPGFFRVEVLATVWRFRFAIIRALFARRLLQKI